MRVPRVRLTVRRMMVAVAVVAVLLTACRHRMLRRSYQDRAYRFLRIEVDLYHLAEDPGYRPLGNSRLTGEAEHLAACHPATGLWPYVEHYARLRRKYSEAAGNPFLPVSPDPPEPE